MDPQDYKSPKEYLDAILEDKIRKQNLLFEERFKAGWARVLPVELFYKALGSDDFSPTAELSYCETLDQAEDQGEEVAKEYVRWMHPTSEGAA